MEIGRKIKARRQSLGLTQSELADRAELSKGFISQLERDLTSPSIATLMDILECLGTDLREFFNEREEEKVTFAAADLFEKSDDEKSILWLVPNAQKNKMEPILLHLVAGCSTEEDRPHEGEEFGYVLSGTVTLVLGMKRHKVRKGGSFYFRADVPHKIENNGKKDAEVVWVSTPPMF
ncbi:MAG: HTH-type transcriptional regulator PuuR [Desulfovibrio sp.]|uniref:cupin domain-containing protein n=1 Tax=Christensenella intestinihominis TaxID=1851429 RepID=UPI00083319B1|nr:cupin domain-containing protein [Christensenella intestinihominis]